MQRALTLAFVFALISVARARAEEGIAWQSNLDAARQLANQTNRLVLLHFWDLGCGPCAKMDQDVFSKASTAKALAPYYVPVKLCASQVPQIRDYFGIKAWPTDVVITPSGQVLDKSVGYRPADQYVGWLTQVALKNHSAATSQPIAAASTSGANNATSSLDSPYSREKYMEYLRQRNPGPTPPAQPVAQQRPAVPPQNPTATQQIAAMPQANAAPPAQTVRNPYPPSGPAAAPGAQASSAGIAAQPSPGRPQISPPIPTPSATVASATSSMRVPSLPASWPPLAMEGQCPVTIVESREWKPGKLQYPANHQGRTYLCAGPEEQQKLLTNPMAYIPANDGFDPVLAVESNREIPGKTNYGILFHGRTYLFAGEDTLAQFEQNPRRYAADVIPASR